MSLEHSLARDGAAADRFIREPEVEHLTGLSRSTIWRLQRTGAFPLRRRLSANVVAWSEAEVRAWMAERTEVAA